MADIRRRVFASWSIVVPVTFVDDETEVGVWAAHDEQRRVWLKSMFFSHQGKPVSAERIMRETKVSVAHGMPIDDVPPGIPGRAWLSPGLPVDAGGSALLTGILALNGRCLLVEITGDDVGWILGTWCSIEGHFPDDPNARIPDG